jgi:CelD/BcsL family acetyltransferase involved in cellulose biosynthesis
MRWETFPGEVNLITIALAASKAGASVNETSPTPASSGEGRRRRRRDSTTVSVSLITTFSELSSFIPEWHDLYERAGRENPFASPDWLMPWAQHFVPERNLTIAVIRRSGELIGLAPWYMNRSGNVVRRLQLLGTGKYGDLTELPQVLTLPGESRSVLRAVVNELFQNSSKWDLFELPLMDDQGWFEPEWLGREAGRSGLVQHTTTRAANILTLPTDLADLQKTLKRNLLESIHRSRNRLNRQAGSWTVTVHEGVDGVEYALPILTRLHTARSRMAERRQHANHLSSDGGNQFVSEALRGMAKSGRAQILTLDVDHHEVAAQVVLYAADSAYVGLSGVDPDWWQVGAVTLLQWCAAEASITRGHQTFNLSVGPNLAKLRWSEKIVQHPSFVVCAPRRYSQLALTGYRAAAAVHGVRREAAYRRVG